MQRKTSSRAVSIICCWVNKGQARYRGKARARLLPEHEKEREKTYRVGGGILGLVGVDGLEVARVGDDGGVLLEGVEGRHFGVSERRVGVWMCNKWQMMVREGKTGTCLPR